MHSIASIICCLYKCAYQLNWHAHHVVTSDAAPKTSASTIITAIMHDTAVWKTSAAADDASALETRHAGHVLHVCMTSANALETSAMCVLHTSDFFASEFLQACQRAVSRTL